MRGRVDITRLFCMFIVTVPFTTHTPCSCIFTITVLICHAHFVPAAMLQSGHAPELKHSRCMICSELHTSRDTIVYCTPHSNMAVNALLDKHRSKQFLHVSMSHMSRVKHEPARSRKCAGAPARMSLVSGAQVGEEMQLLYMPMTA